MYLSLINSSPVRCVSYFAYVSNSSRKVCVLLCIIMFLIALAVHLSTYLSSIGQTRSRRRWVGGLQYWMCVRATRGKFWLVFVLCLFVCLFVCVDRLAAGGVCKQCLICKLFANCLFAKNPAPAGVCKQCLFANCLQTELLANGCRILLLGMKVLFFPVDIVLFLGMKVLFFPVAQLAASQVDPRCLRRPPGPPSVTHNLPRNHVCVRAALGKFWLVFVLCFCVCKQCLFANCLQTVCLLENFANTQPCN